MPHTGIDLSTGGEKTPIVSLIYGIVWARANIEVFGKVMLIKSLNEDKLYFLAHLDDFKKEVDETFEPEEEIAITGNTTGGTGSSTGIHLHLEVYRNIKANPDENEKILNMKSIENIRRYNELWNLNGNTITDFLRQHRVNPFKHDEHLV